jgi:uncharacterized Ntn-hydrolase superfamily protein
MTWSIVAKDAASGAFGVAVASKVLAVGAICPWLEAGTGALSTQSYTNPLYGPDILAKLAAGDSIEAAIGAVTTADEGRAFRQVHGVDARGNAFAYTGASCVDCNGHALGEGVSVAGNMLAGPAVVAEAMKAWTDGWEKPFAQRLVDALAAGELAGGDKRGKQSAAIKIVKTEPWPWVDLRIDDAAEPVRDLSRMLDTFLAERAPYYVTLATRENPAGVYDPAERETYQAGYRKALGEER